MEEHLQQAAVVPQDLTAGDFPVAGHADLVGDPVSRQVVFRSADHGDLRDRVDADGKVGGHRRGIDSERETRGQAALFARRGRETRKTDGVAGGENMRHARLEVLVHAEASATLGEASRILPV